MTGEGLTFAKWVQRLNGPKASKTYQDYMLGSALYLLQSSGFTSAEAAYDYLGQVTEYLLGKAPFPPTPEGVRSGTAPGTRLWTPERARDGAEQAPPDRGSGLVVARG